MGASRADRRTEQEHEQEQEQEQEQERENCQPIPRTWLVGDNPGTIEQSFATDVGKVYLFSGVIAHNPANFYFAEGRGNVFIDRTFLTQLLHQDPTVTVSEVHWTPFSVQFRATKSMTTLTISDATGSPFPGGLVLDDLAVSPAGP